MKKEYKNPKIKINTFMTENIVTTSGTYTQKVTTEIGASENGLTTVKFGDLQFEGGI